MSTGPPDFDSADAAKWSNQAVALSQQGRYADAELFARQAVRAAPLISQHWVTLGNALFNQRRWAEAACAFEQSVKLCPNSPLAWNNWGAALLPDGRLNEARQALEQSLELAPDQPGAQINYAAVLCQQGLHGQGLQILERVLVLYPQSAQAWMTAGIAMRFLGDFPRAVEALRRANQLAPNQLEVGFNLAYVLFREFYFDEAMDLTRQLVDHYPHAADAWTLLFTLQRYADGTTPEMLLKSHRKWNDIIARPYLPPKPRRVTKTKKDRLRLGFVSADFGRHPISFLGLPAFEHLDKSQCSVMCYSDRVEEDSFTERFKAVADVWRSTVGASDEEVATQVAADDVDVLVDLMGHTGKRMLVFARRPAPVQVTWLGYVGTTGLGTMDYLLADRFHVRADEDEHYTEKVLRMPHSYSCYGPPVDMPDVVPLPALSSGHVTFGSFNNPAKYTNWTFGAWANILRAVPGARLLLKYGGLDDASLQRRIHERFWLHGIEPERVVIEGYGRHRDHLAAYSRVDIALDTQPYSGGVTSCEALWMGVPVITFPGATFAGRHSTSHLMNAGLPEFVAPGPGEYVDLAVRWANAIETLADLRMQLRQSVARSRLCDAPQFARDFLNLMRYAVQSAAPSFYSAG